MSESAQFVHDLIGSMRCGFILPGILKHNIPEKLVESPKTVEELAEGTSINPDRLHRFMRHLENYGMFSFDESTKKWSNTEKSSHFLNAFAKASLLFKLNPKLIEL